MLKKFVAHFKYVTKVLVNYTKDENKRRQEKNEEELIITFLAARTMMQVSGFVVVDH